MTSVSDVTEHYTHHAWHIKL